jgi:Domain of unknown function (DUF5076)
VFNRRKNELELPPMAKDATARAILRVWAGPGLPQQVTLNVPWDDPAAWNLVLVDIARHV